MVFVDSSVWIALSDLEACIFLPAFNKFIAILAAENYSYLYGYLNRIRSAITCLARRKLIPF